MNCNARSYYQVRLRAEQIEAARQQVRAAAEAVPLNFEAIVGGELRAIEGLQAVQGLAAARAQYLSAVLDCNRAPLQLVRARTAAGVARGGGSRRRQRAEAGTVARC